ncbi:MAG: hypothetical protein ACO2O6_03345 [Candidatus Hydrothermia bacterium]|jgi:methyl-accepting chemotaxis protein
MINFIIDILGSLILSVLSVFFVLPNIKLLSGAEYLILSLVLAFMTFLFIWFEVLTYFSDEKDIIVMRNINSIFVVIGLLGTLISLAYSFYGLYNLVGGTQAEITSNLKNLLSQIKVVFIPSILGVYFTIWGTIKLSFIERRYFSRTYEAQNLDKLIESLSKLEELENLKKLENLKELSNLSKLSNYLEQLNKSLTTIDNLTKIVNNLPDKINRSLDEFVKSLEKNVIKKLEEQYQRYDVLVKTITEETNDLSQKYKELSKTIKNTNDNLSLINDYVWGLSENLIRLVENIEKNVITKLEKLSETIKNTNDNIKNTNDNLSVINNYVNSLPSTIQNLTQTYIQTFKNIETTIKEDLPSKLEDFNDSVSKFISSVEEVNKKLEQTFEDLKEIKNLSESIKEAVKDGLEIGISKYIKEPIENLNNTIESFRQVADKFPKEISKSSEEISKSSTEISKITETLKDLTASIEKLFKTLDRTIILFRIPIGKRRDEISKR